MLIDTHAHLNFSAFDKDRNILIEKCLKNNIWMINIGTSYETSKKAIEIAESSPQGIFAAIGLHPINLDTGLVKIKKDLSESESFFLEREFDSEKYEKLAKNKKVVAIGEIGLDYYWKPKTTRKKELFKQKQKDLFLKQLSLAQKLNLPVIFHCRMAHTELFELLKSKIKNKKSKIKGVMHGFVGTLEQLQKYLKMGFYIGFNGIIFKEIEGINFRENIRKTPLERILIETDCPYLIPPLARRSFAVKRNEGGPEQIDRNEPIFVKYIAQEIAKIKNLDYQKVAEITTQNAKKLFNL